MGIVFAGADFSLSAQIHCRADRHPCIPAGADLLGAASQHHKGLGLKVEGCKRWCFFLQLSVHRGDVLHNAWQSKYADVYFQWTIDKRNYGRVHCPLLLLLSLQPLQSGTSQAWFNLSLELPVLLMRRSVLVCEGMQGSAQEWSFIWVDILTQSLICLWVLLNLLSGGAGGGCWQVVPHLTLRDNKANCAYDSFFIFSVS